MIRTCNLRAGACQLDNETPNNKYMNTFMGQNDKRSDFFLNGKICEFQMEIINPNEFVWVIFRLHTRIFQNKCSQYYKHSAH